MQDKDHAAPGKDFYTPADVESIVYEQDLGDPGCFPFTRGIHPRMYGERLWTTRQLSGGGSPEAANELLRLQVEEGRRGLSLALDLPTQLGLDSDHPLGRGEVGKVGVAIDSVADMEILLDGLPLEEISLSLAVSGPAAVLLAMLVAVAEKRGIPRGKLQGTIQNDILKEYMVGGAFLFPPGPSLRLVGETMAFCAREMPGFHAVSVSGFHLREAGSSAAQEIGLAVAAGLTYLEQAVAMGVPANEAAGQISFFFSSGMDIMEEVGKFRAARRIWARELARRGVTSPAAQKMRFHAHTSDVAISAADQELNLVRVGLAALAAVLGGAQSLHTSPWNGSHGLPTRQAQDLAVRTQELLAREAGVTAVADPLGGSYYLEWLTGRLEREALRVLRRVEELGGMLRAVEGGELEREVAASAFRQEERRRPLPVEETLDGGRHWKGDPAVARRQVERLAELRARRDTRLAAWQLQRLRRAVAAGENLLPYLVEAASAQATLGEICGVLREVFGVYRKLPRRVGGQGPRVLIAKIGLDGHDRGAKVLAEGLAGEGLEVIYAGPRLSPERVVEIALEHQVAALGLSSMTGNHMYLFPPVVELLRERGAGDVLVLGGGLIPEGDVSYLKRMGVAEVFGPGTSIAQVGEWLRRNLGAGEAEEKRG